MITGFGLGLGSGLGVTYLMVMAGGNVKRSSCLSQAHDVKKKKEKKKNNPVRGAGRPNSEGSSSPKAEGQRGWL